MTDEQVRVLVVAGSPEPCSPDLLAGLARVSDIVVACDHGADACRAAAVVPDVFCGDADSISEGGLEWVRTHVDDERFHPSAKDDTDLTLALDLAHELALARGSYVETVVTCASGGRPDHALGVVCSLAHHTVDSPRLIEDGFEARILSPMGNHVWSLPADAKGKTFSMVPLAQDSVVSEVGMAWELDHRTMGCLDPLGVSNVVTSTSARLVVHEGMAIGYLLA
ncbi:MAG: thiamine diphosphokinase [Atopobiaceae bacterium]|jgi:thiamine pyrophosphokinase|nr:thiamine diphosphokinase [Atopobiaceae bacterium]MCI2173335.1 thiamine diphosphokinase [Atopobiaceae bacterium]MCI2207330.1 thiamine diphosphokinase [Atopobiaceae bacterium]